jgi:hypothetical protein
MVKVSDAEAFEILKDYVDALRSEGATEKGIAVFLLDFAAPLGLQDLALSVLLAECETPLAGHES